MNLTKEQQEKYMQLQMLSQQLKATEQELHKLDQHHKIMIDTLEQLDNLKNAKAGSETFVPVCNGIFAKAELKDCSKLLVNVGAGVIVEKDIASTKKLVESQLEQLAQVRMQLTNDLQTLSMEGHHLEHEISGTKCEH
ncbi:MAG: prefoldin subunit alpha [Candidatus Woesearchaeota archaeon]